jgi:hypothetical protein
MAERTHIPGSPACGEWETLLTDALDGLLGPDEEARFAAHKAGCPACAALYDEARKGRQWLEFLSPEPEVPLGLLEKILAATGPEGDASGDWTGNALPVAAGAAAIPGFVPPVWQQPGFSARMRAAMQPRILMTVAMAFFSIALTLNITGVRLASVHVTPLRLADLRPRNLRAYMERQLNMASVPIVRYYDHNRFVYEVEEQVRELRGDTEEQQPQDQPRPGQTQRIPAGKGGDLHAGPQPATRLAPGSNFVETSLKRSGATGSATGRTTSSAGGRATSGAGRAARVAGARAERSARWIA